VSGDARPGSARPAWVFLVCGVTAVVVYGFAPADLEPTLFPLIMVGSIIAIIVGIRRAPPQMRRPWWVTVAGATIFLVTAIVRGL
jgi:hypothetical protein